MVRLVNVVVSSPSPENAAGNAEAAARWLRADVVSGVPVDVIGPAPSPIERLHGRWRWHFLLRSASVRALGDTARRLRSEFRTRGRDVRITIDRDPSALL
jgi:primosomal protein N' (replication factor Y)